MIIRNIAILSAIQVVNYATPIATLLLLTKSLSPETYASTAAGLSNSAIAFFISDFGTNIYLLKKNNKFNTFSTKTRIFSCFTIRILVFLCYSTLILLTTNNSQANLFLITAIPQLFFLTWLYISTNNNSTNIFSILTGKALLILTLVMYCDKTTTPIEVALIYFFSNTLSASIYNFTTIFIKKTTPIPSIRAIIATAKSSFPFFLSRCYSTPYSLGSTYILSLLNPGVHVGTYSISELAYKAYVGVSWPISSALIPYLRTRKHLIPISLLGIFIISLFCLLLGLMFSTPIIESVFPEHGELLASATKYTIIAGTVNIFSTCIGHPILGNIGLSKLVNRSTSLGLFTFLASLVLIPTLGMNYFTTTLIALLAAELSVFAFRLYLLSKHLHRDIQNY